ncbi:MAG: hypothetical protein ACQEW9_17405 [Bacteroidota bacterium]
MYINFENMPESSRVWVYQAEREFTSSEKQWIDQQLKLFCERWNVHGNPLPTSYTIIDQQVLVLAVDESGPGASGCSIDSSVRTLKDLEARLQVNLTDSGKVSFKSAAGKIQVTQALGIKSKIQSGEIQPDTLVINPQIQAKSDLQQVWVSAEKSWLNKYFPN